MEDINFEEIKQLMLFYKHKSAELEFENLKLQLKLNSIVEDTTQEK